MLTFLFTRYHHLYIIAGSVGFKDRDYKFDEGKRYELTTSMSYFKVNQNNGQITIEEATPHGSYQLNIKVCPSPTSPFNRLTNRSSIISINRIIFLSLFCLISLLSLLMIILSLSILLLISSVSPFISCIIPTP